MTINIIISKIWRKKVRGNNTYLLDETNVENIVIFDVFFLLFGVPKDTNA